MSKEAKMESDTRQNTDKMQRIELDDFDKVTSKIWRDKVEEQLKGAPFEKKLVKNRPEKIAVEPVYNRENTQAPANEMPGAFPFTRGTNALSKAPAISQEIDAFTAIEFNTIMHDATKRGQNSIYLRFDDPSKCGMESIRSEKMGLNGVSIVSVDDITAALKGLDLKALKLFVDVGASGLAAVAMLKVGIEKLGFDSNEIEGAVLYDPHTRLMEMGALATSLPEHYLDLAKIVKLQKTAFKKCTLVGVNAAIAREGGGSATEELALAMASAVEYMHALSEKNMEIDDVAPIFMFTLTSGSDFFMEIAKFRAARRLWAHIVKAFGGNPANAPFKVHVTGMDWNKTIYDPYVNMLRGTTESFAAMIGGVDSLHSVSFDESFSKTDSFSRRIARNTQVVLGEETHANRVQDPAGGSWYIETLTDKLSVAAWELFTEIEKEGGLIKALQSGFIQTCIEKVAAQKQSRIGKRQDGLVGTSLFANIDETLPEHRPAISTEQKQERIKEIKTFIDKRDNLLIARALTKFDGSMEQLYALVKNGATLDEVFKSLNDKPSNIKVQPIKKEKAAAAYEAMRGNALAYKEKNGTFPAVVLATMGPLRQHKARADFIHNFILPGGFKTVESGKESSNEDILNVVKEHNSKAVVICSTDDTYKEVVPEVTKALKAYNPKIQVLVAGNPKEIIEELKQVGVDDFIHIKSDNLAMLQTLQTKTGVA